MVDGKALNAITGTSSQQVCSICKASPTKTNFRAKLIKKISDKNTFEYGISPLHLWIRNFE